MNQAAKPKMFIGACFFVTEFYLRLHLSRPICNLNGMILRFVIQPPPMTIAKAYFL